MNSVPLKTPLLVQTRQGIVETWLFDLDNTLYSPTSKLFDQIDTLMGQYISDLLGVGLLDARKLQKLYYKEHGTTLNGLMRHHGVDPDDYLEYVHNIDLSVIGLMPSLATALAALPGRKIIFTNGSVAHAERVLARLGVQDCFEGIHDIKASGYKPKPNLEAYHSVISRFSFEPTSAIMVEDIAINLKPAAEVGLTTVWVRHDHSLKQETRPYIDYVTDNLVAWLQRVETI